MLGSNSCNHLTVYKQMIDMKFQLLVLDMNI